MYTLEVSANLFIALCSLIEVDRCFRGAYCLHHQGDDHPDEGRTQLWNISLRQQAYIRCIL